jgi:mannan endo-1,4-beta-mannosidase
LDYIQQLVNRYKDHPALGMWEPVNEPEASTCPPENITTCSGIQTCPNETVAAQALLSFFDDVGPLIHELDPNHLVESGFIGGGQCGTSGSDYAYVGASSGIDVLTYHDYYPANEPMGGDQWNGLAVRFQQAKQLGKPIIGGECGIYAGGPGCDTFQQRAIDYKARLDEQFGNGTSALLIWDYMNVNTSSSGQCSYNTWYGDAVVDLIINYPSQNNWPVYGPANSSAQPSTKHSSDSNRVLPLIIFEILLVLTFYIISIE